MCMNSERVNLKAAVALNCSKMFRQEVGLHGIDSSTSDGGEHSGMHESMESEKDGGVECVEKGKKSLEETDIGTHESDTVYL